MTKKTVTADKLSKKKKKELNRKKRLTWGQVKPGTLTLKSERDYDRNREKQEVLGRIREGE